ncbi:tetratricopeptide repeat-containing sensor histidine kinase [Tenacibaculum larymnensis]|uniref:Tetratricopeptide repeat protein n=1 Tax=Tenacibaculum larymnensis TaxID=2878201 RepID=A0A9X4ES10_9FLAO|nr:tetratricopeptide repeat protein [Tenacibaculum larymnensis]MDE1208274.1 tetratricopeptide repeat protein [Tenacibaculum larymnensis]
MYLLKYFLIIVSLFYTITAQCTNSIDSLDYQKTYTYKEINRFLKKHNKDTTIQKELFEKFKKNNFAYGQIYELIHLGNNYRKYSLFDKAIITHKHALEIAKRAKNDEFIIFSLNMIGVDYRKKDAHKTAIDYNQEALKVAEKIVNPTYGILRSIEVSYNSIGNIYFYLEQYDLALKNYKAALKYAKKSKNKWSQSINYENIGKIKIVQNNFNEAEEYILKALEIDTSIKNHFGRMICYNSLAYVNIKTNNYQKAKEYLKLAMPIALSVKNKFYIASTKANLGYLYLKTKQHKLAKEFLGESLNIATKESFKTLLVNIHNYFYEFYLNNNQHKTALYHYRKHIEIRQQLNANKKAQYVNDLVLKYETNKKKELIEKLESEKKISDLNHENSKNLWLMGFSIVISLFLIIYFFSRQKQLQAKKKISDLQSTVLRSQLNPHFIFNALNSIKHYIIKNKKHDAIDYLNKFSEFTRRVLEKSILRSISLEDELYNSQLYVELENARFEDNINFEIDVSKDISLSSIIVPPFILQPLLENAIWHGIASIKNKRISIHIHQLKEHIYITITDNGIGRQKAYEIKKEQKKYKSSIGINLVNQILENFYKEKYTLSYKDLDINNEFNTSKGTMVTIKIPILTKLL